MRTPLTSIILRILAACIFSTVFYGCAGPEDSNEPKSMRMEPSAATPTEVRQPPQEPKPIIVAETLPKPGNGNAPATLIDARPAAMLNGQTVSWGELRPILNEAAGAEALQELILDRKVEKALADAGIRLTDDAIAAERKTLLETLNPDPSVALRLLDELRDRQRLGKVRFSALMRRNAGLRALVRDRVQINEASIDVMYRMMHGPKRQVRLMVLPDLAAAEGAINLVKSGASFSDVAVEMSTDSSASRGGLLEPISDADPSYPESLRQTIFSLNAGEMSGPILLNGQYAVVLLVRRLAPDQVTMEAARASVERMVRINQERILMDQLARNMLADTSVTIFDESLNEAWSRRTHAVR